MTKIYDFDPRNLPPELLQAIGLGIASSAQTESIVERAIWGCLGIDAEYGMAATTHMSAPLRISVLKSAAEIRIDHIPHLDELDEILTQVESALDKRNEFAHRMWARDEDTGELFVLKQAARAGLEVELIPKTADAVKSDAIAIYHAGMRLQTFLMDADLLAALPQGRPRAHKTRKARAKLRKKK